jgi:hypothetical protein
LQVTNADFIGLYSANVVAQPEMKNLYGIVLWVAINSTGAKITSIPDILSITSQRCLLQRLIFIKSLCAGVNLYILFISLDLILHFLFKLTH